MGGVGEVGILTATADGVRTVTVSRPKVRNALNVADRLALRDALVAADADPAVRVVVITGAAGQFCSGGDIREFGRFHNEEEAHRYAVEVAQTVFSTVRSLATPTVARVEGVAAGAGMFLALGCDIVVAGEDARFVASHLRLGVPPDWGAMWLLPRLVGMARAKLLLLTARPIDGPLAAQWGLIATCVPNSQLEQVVAGVCRDLRSLPPGALSLTRQGIERSLDMGLEEFLAWEAAGMAKAMVTAEHHARVEAFLAAGDGR
jgi:2-(1,2-epoxy-1,2-dihydrophenyl)acetyl-CoA isomerase